MSDLDLLIRSIEVKTVISEPGFTVYSPFDVTQTVEWASLIRAELAEMNSFFGFGIERPTKIYLRPVSPEESASEIPRLLQEMFPNRGGVAGHANHDGDLVIHVARSPTNPALNDPTRYRETLRHELAHLFVYEIALDAGNWFNEGIAMEAASMVHAQDGTWHPDPLPDTLPLAEEALSQASLSWLLDWDHPRGPLEMEPDSRERYALDQSFARFLLLREPALSFADAVRNVAHLRKEQLLALEPEWREWMESWDSWSLIERAVQGGDPEFRNEAAELLPILAECGDIRALSREGDVLALGLLKSPETREPALRFLYFFRAPKLSHEDLEQLTQDPDPFLRFAGLVLKDSRGESQDPATLWSALDAFHRSDDQRSVFEFYITTPKARKNGEG